jgi:hypothetical protein
MWWLCGVALAGRWDNEPVDVEVKSIVPRPVEEIHAKLLDWAGWQSIFPEDCASEWEIYGEQRGKGAQATALYTIGPMRRRLTGVITQERSNQFVETELQGKKGWFVQVTYEPAEGGTAVTMRTPLERPRWPETPIYFGRVKPAWEACYLDALANLGKS